MSKSQFNNTYNSITSIENLLEAWKEFVRGKRSRKDVQEFERNLMPNIILLHRELATKTYAHSSYKAFRISDPKLRDIHKASVRDRLLHHALHRKLSPFFAKTFISDSNSCQKGKGTHRALRRFGEFINIISENNTRTVWVLKCDIKKFFANIDQLVLMNIVASYIPDRDIVWLTSVVVQSFHSGTPSVGLPLGNLTSQLLVNIYMNKFDQFMKHRLKAKYYIRYADDFVIFDTDKDRLLEMTPKIADFLEDELRLSLHPKKVSISTIVSGVDYLGWVHFPDHRVLRTVTKKRMFRGIRLKDGKEETVQSYLGLLSHGNAEKLKAIIKPM
jgi:retron-type reverse transcriptase